MIMADHNELGEEGENAAVAYLEAQGYRILHRNWRKGKYELDIVATKDEELIVAEVKTRASTRYGNPWESVTTQKIKNTTLAANAYIHTYEIDYSVRFDIIDVVGKEGKFKIDHIKEAFYPPLC